MNLTIRFRWQTQYNPVVNSTAKTLHWYASYLRDPDDMAGFVCSVLGADWFRAIRIFDRAIHMAVGPECVDLLNRTREALMELSRKKPSDGGARYRIAREKTGLLVTMLRPWPWLEMHQPLWDTLSRAAPDMAPRIFWRLTAQLYRGEFRKALAEIRLREKEKTRQNDTYQAALARRLFRDVVWLRDTTSNPATLIGHTFDSLGLGRLKMEGNHGDGRNTEHR